ncbi:universal stress protein [Nonomuraea sp. NPDC049504]|uniref:universal stress protein n=1 Tax=Nonomuraea sp. NPDC049504 TaxID=3154729 RepID=UPI00341AFD5F
MAGHIVVGVDGSTPATAALEWAAADAQRRGLSLRVVHVCEQSSCGGEAAEYCARTLAAAAERARELTRDVVASTDRLAGNVIETLIEEAAVADSVVLGGRGLGGFAGLVVGSVGLGVAGHAAGPVVIVRGPSVVQHDQVVVGYDGSAHSEAAMQYAVDQARAREVRLRVVYAWQAPIYSPYAVAHQHLVQAVYEEEIRAADEHVTRWREKNPDIRITGEQVAGHPVNALTKAGGTADLVVVGSRGLGGFASAVFGSVSHGVLHHLACPVAVVRPHEPPPGTRPRCSSAACRPPAC